jgi:hypothetical protein
MAAHYAAYLRSGKNILRLTHLPSASSLSKGDGGTSSFKAGLHRNIKSV